MGAIEKYDFFTDGERDFYNKFSHKSILCQGNHWDKAPFVTILIPTYKRPELLRQALESALNQKKFDDYQIIVVDNEGEPADKETATSRVVKDYQNEKVIYYRHDRELTIYRMDSAVRLAKSPWIVFLHDDDIIADNHLKIMTDIIKKHREIKFLGCPMKSFIKEKELKKEKKSSCNYKIVKYLKNTTCLGDWSGWLGAMISRKHYIAIGGMPSITMQVGDQGMVAKFLHHFGTYGCISDSPLYYYRTGEQQETYKAKKVTNRINEYYLYKYVINQYHRVTHKLWERNAAYVVLETAKRYNNSALYRANIDIDCVIAECGMPKNINQKDVWYYFTKAVFMIYRKCIDCWDDLYVNKLKLSDIHVRV